MGHQLVVGGRQHILRAGGAVGDGVDEWPAVGGKWAEVHAPQGDGVATVGLSGRHSGALDSGDLRHAVRGDGVAAGLATDDDLPLQLATGTDGGHAGDLLMRLGDGARCRVDGERGICGRGVVKYALDGRGVDTKVLADDPHNLTTLGVVALHVLADGVGLELADDGRRVAGANHQAATERRQELLGRLVADTDHPAEAGARANGGEARDGTVGHRHSARRAGVPVRLAGTADTVGGAELCHAAAGGGGGSEIRALERDDTAALGGGTYRALGIADEQHLRRLVRRRDAAEQASDAANGDAPLQVGANARHGGALDGGVRCQHVARRLVPQPVAGVVAVLRGHNVVGVLGGGGELVGAGAEVGAHNAHRLASRRGQLGCRDGGHRRLGVRRGVQRTRPGRRLATDGELPLQQRAGTRHRLAGDDGVGGGHDAAGGGVLQLATVDARDAGTVIAKVGTRQHDILAAAGGGVIVLHEAGDRGRNVGRGGAHHHTLAVDGDRPHVASTDAGHGCARDLRVAATSDLAASRVVGRAALSGLGVGGGDHGGRVGLHEPKVGAGEHYILATCRRELRQADRGDGQVVHVGDDDVELHGVEQRVRREVAVHVGRPVDDRDRGVVRLHGFVVQRDGGAQHRAIHLEVLRVEGERKGPVHAVSIRVDGSEVVDGGASGDVLEQGHHGRRRVQHRRFAHVGHTHIHTERVRETVGVHHGHGEVVPQLRLVVKLRAVRDCERPLLVLVGRPGDGESAILVAVGDGVRERVGVATTLVRVDARDAVGNHGAHRGQLRHGQRGIQAHRRLVDVGDDDRERPRRRA